MDETPQRPDELDAAAAAQVQRLLGVMRRLRVGCPWDREQDLKSLRPYLIEEAYEVLDALDSGSLPALREELGDLLFQIVFQAHLAEERAGFAMVDVVAGIANKLESRHPHVFAGLEGIDAEGALKSWSALKRAERQRAGHAHPSAIDGVPTQAPALLRAERTGEKAARVGFDWPDIVGVRAKVTEELAELDEAIASGDRQRADEELGDVLFSLCNLARWLKTPAENALRGAISRFEGRFRHLEAALEAQGRSPGQADSAELDRLWREAKRAVQGS